MKPLGHISIGPRRIAMRARTVIRKHGQAAVFLDCTTGEAAAVEWSDPDYEGAMQRQSAHLVGVYRDDLRGSDGLLEQIRGDLAVHARAHGLVSQHPTARERILQALAAHSRTTTELTELLGVTPCYVRNVLRTLRLAGDVRSSHSGGRDNQAKVWSLAGGGGEAGAA